MWRCRSSVAAAATKTLPESVYHIDTQLQRACVTHLEIDAEVSRKHAEEVNECGFANLLDGWVNVIADRFVRDTRFDPLHAAETEQQLYNQVYDWVTSDAAPPPEIGIEIDYRDHVRRVELPRSVIEDKAQQRFNRLREALPDASHVVLSARSARLPGLTQFLSRQGHEFTLLASDALVNGCTANMEHLRSSGGQLRLVSRLALATPSSRAPRRADSAATDLAVGQITRPTHTLTNSTAVAIGARNQPLPLSETEAGVYLEATADLLLNGNPLTATTRVSVGDGVVVGDGVGNAEVRYLLICVET